MKEQDSLGQNASQQHAYYRSFNANDNNSITAICDKIKPDSLVLDLGSGCGVIGEYLNMHKNCIIDGVDLNLEQAVHSDCYRSLQSANLETQTLSDIVSDCYDVIICADLLEHLRNPQHLLAQLGEFLKPDGRVLLSVPNVAHIGLVSDLVEGKFEYRSEGLLDNTHVRFFTRYSLKNLLRQSGLGIVVIEQIELDPRETEFECYPERFPPKLYNLLAARADALTYQFIVEATCNDLVKEYPDEDSKQENGSPVTLSYSAQLFWRGELEDYTHNRSVTAIGRIGEERQQLLLEIPQIMRDCNALRLDIADRSGYVRINEIILCNSAGLVIWEWDGKADSLFSFGHRHNIEIAPQKQPDSGVVALLGSTDSYFELPVPADALQEIADGGSLQLTQSFPMSADYLVLTPRLEELAKQQHEEIDSLKALIELRDHELAVRDATIQAYEAGPKEREQLIVSQQHKIEELKHLTLLQKRQIQEREELIDERNKWLAEKQDRAEQQYQKMLGLEALMKQHNTDMVKRTSDVEFREQSIGQQLQIKDESINTLTDEIEELQQQLEYRMSMQFWLHRPFIYLRDRVLEKLF